MTLGMLSVTIMTRKNVSNKLYPCIFLMWSFLGCNFIKCLRKLCL